MTAAAGVIERVAWQSFRIPFARAFQTSKTALAVREGFLVAIETSHGVGTGEASPLPEFGGGTLEETGQALELLARKVLGCKLDLAWAATGEVDGDFGQGSLAAARAGLETAIADAAARAAGLPFWQWLARREGFALDAAPVIPVNAIVDAEKPLEVAQNVREAAAAGFRTVKLKVGGRGPDDLDRIAAAREAGGKGLQLRIDANGAWDDDSAVALLAQCEGYRVALCEQPLDPRRDDVFAATARLRKRVTVPIALDESIRTAGDLSAALDQGAADAIVVKPMLTGLREAVEILRAAQAASLPVIVTTAFDSGIGTAVALHLAALLPEPRPACGLATLERLENDLVESAFACHDGSMAPGLEPGLGVLVDDDAVRTYSGAISGSVGR